LAVDEGSGQDGLSPSTGSALRRALGLDEYSEREGNGRVASGGPSWASD
jgi:hypothetical protein